MNMQPDKLLTSKQGEKIEMIIRKHWITDLKVTMIVFLAYIMPAIFFAILVITYWPGSVEKLGGAGSLIALIYLLYAGLGLYIKWLNEELDILVVTNFRLINLEQVTFMERTVSETNLQQIQDVKGIEKGVLGNLLRYGDLQIQTAAEKVAFCIKCVPQPFRYAREILDLRDKSLTQPPPQ